MEILQSRGGPKCPHGFLELHCPLDINTLVSTQTSNCNIKKKEYEKTKIMNY